MKNRSLKPGGRLRQVLLYALSRKAVQTWLFLLLAMLEDHKVALVYDVAWQVFRSKHPAIPTPSSEQFK